MSSNDIMIVIIYVTQYSYLYVIIYLSFKLLSQLHITIQNKNTLLNIYTYS